MRRLVPFAVFALLLVPALACGNATPTPRVQPGGAARPSAAPSAAPAAVGKVGDTITLQDYAIGLHAKQDPATAAFPAPAGQRYVAYDVTIAAISPNVAYNPLYGKLKMADNTEATAGFVGPSPALQSGTLAAGESARGWLSFTIPMSAQPATLTYEIIAFGSGGKAVFDVR
jgi:hypothetical protein